MEATTESGFIDQPPEKLPGQAVALVPSQQLALCSSVPWMQMRGHPEGRAR